MEDHKTTYAALREILGFHEGVPAELSLEILARQTSAVRAAYSASREQLRTEVQAAYDTFFSAVNTIQIDRAPLTEGARLEHARHLEPPTAGRFDCLAPILASHGAMLSADELLSVLRRLHQPPPTRGFYELRRSFPSLDRLAGLIARSIDDAIEERAEHDDELHEKIETMQRYHLYYEETFPETRYRRVMCTASSIEEMGHLIFDRPRVQYPLLLVGSTKRLPLTTREQAMTALRMAFSANLTRSSDAFGAVDFLKRYPELLALLFDEATAQRLREWAAAQRYTSARGAGDSEGATSLERRLERLEALLDNSTEAEDGGENEEIADALACRLYNWLARRLDPIYPPQWTEDGAYPSGVTRGYIRLLWQMCVDSAFSHNCGPDDYRAWQSLEWIRRLYPLFQRLQRLYPAA